MGYYYLKLHYDLLYDPKVNRLPVNLRWRFIQALLLAGELDEDGFLPVDMGEVAWTLREEETAVTSEFSQLAQAHLLELKLDEDGNERWFVTNFAKRQRALSDSERKAKSRARKKKQKEKETNIYIKGHRDTPVTNRDIKPVPDVMTPLIIALSSVVKEVWAPGFNEETYEDAATALFGWDATREEIEAFGLWWEKCGWHTDRPALKNVINHWRDFKAGKNLRKPEKQNPKTALLESLLALVDKYGRDGYKEAKPELEEAGLVPYVAEMGRWAHVCLLPDKTLRFAFFDAYERLAVKSG